MIHFEITQSPDGDVKSKFKFLQNEIYLGKKNGNLVIDDPSLHDTHLMIEVVEGELLVHPQKIVSHYLIDGKRATTIRKIKPGQVITIGKTLLKVIEFEGTQLPTKKEILDSKLNHLLEINSDKLQVIEKLAQMMK